MFTVIESIIIIKFYKLCGRISSVVVHKVQMFYLKMPVVEPVILSLLEKVCVAVIILEGIVDMVWNPLPVGNWPEGKMEL